MKTLFTLAWRNLWRKKKRTVITASSVMFAVILAIVLMSMVTGMREVMVDSIITNTTGHLQIQDVLYDEEPSIDHSLYYNDQVRAAIDRHSGEIAYTVPRIGGFCLAAKEITSRGVYLMGILPQRESRMNDLSSRLTEGKMFTAEDDFAVVARGVADLLDLSLGDTITMMGQGFQGMTASGQYRVGGILEFPLPEQNNTMVYLPLKEAQHFFAAPDRLNSLIIMLDDEKKAAETAQRIQGELDQEWYVTKTWEELMPAKVAAFDARDAQISIFAWVLYMVAGFGILGTIITMIHERLREFGILLSIGLKRSQLAIICLMETLLISMLGVIAGIVLGSPLMYWFYKNPIQFTGEVAEAFYDYGIKPQIHFAISPEIYLNQSITIFIIALVIGMYPAHKAFTINMVRSART